MAQLRRILCPIDFSDPSNAALRYADALAERIGAELVLVHVHAMPFYPFEDGTGYGEDLRQQVLVDLQADMDQRLASLSSPARGVVVEGVPHREIVAAAATEEADLIAMGTHGRTGLSRVLLGSVAERVVRTSPIPVITIPRAEA